MGAGGIRWRRAHLVQDGGALRIRVVYPLHDLGAAAEGRDEVRRQIPVLRRAARALRRGAHGRGLAER